MMWLIRHLIVLCVALLASIPAVAKESKDDPFFTVQMPEDSLPCVDSLRDELIVIYDKYNRAAKSGDFEEFQKYIIDYQAKGMREALTKVSDRTEQEKKREFLKEIASYGFSVQACIVSKDSFAALAGKGKRAYQGKMRDANGTIVFKRENSIWKVQNSVWNPQF